ncbi:hypothetical protein K402DRAFT_462256 [Aulographum hederae CBS 113979]|uniref:Uncharacterized protein n=1 Tax=Aulographum hederae CBS 113979 TaxID=1176131 RepID=A0A6G1H5R0_9PEZI|nr:hypothetical protein K402DRAFT_462256 [Aulographum hederae CBS 113979]
MSSSSSTDGRAGRTSPAAADLAPSPPPLPKGSASDAFGVPAREHERVAWVTTPAAPSSSPVTPAGSPGLQRAAAEAREEEEERGEADGEEEGRAAEAGSGSGGYAPSMPVVDRGWEYWPGVVYRSVEGVEELEDPDDDGALDISDEINQEDRLGSEEQDARDGAEIERSDQGSQDAEEMDGIIVNTNADPSLTAAMSTFAATLKNPPRAAFFGRNHRLKWSWVRNLNRGWFRKNHPFKILKNSPVRAAGREMLGPDPFYWRWLCHEFTPGDWKLVLAVEFRRLGGEERAWRLQAGA